MMGLTDIIGGAASLFGGISGNNQQQQQNQITQQQLQQQNQIEQQELGVQQGTVNAFNQYYAPEQSGAASAINNLLSGAGQAAGGAATSFMNAAGSPGGLSQATGVNGQGLTQAALGYLSNPGATQTGQIGQGVVSGLGGPTATSQSLPGLQNFYQGEMQGNSPQLQQAQENAQSQLQQQFAQSQADITAHAAPGQNTSAALQNAQNALLSSSTNLAGSNAAQTFGAEQAGAQGLQGVNTAADQQKIQQLLSQLQAAGVIDSQTMSMLTGGANLANNYNQTTLGNMGEAAQEGQNAVNSATNYIQQGRQNVAQAGVGLGNLAGQVGQQAVNSQAQANSYGNPFATALGGITTALGNAGIGNSPQSTTPGF